MLRIVAQGGLADAVNGDNDDDDDDDEGGEDDDDGDDLDGEEDAEVIEDEDHGNGDTEAVVPEVLPAGARRPPVETP
jgi:hypothetical protein